MNLPSIEECFGLKDPENKKECPFDFNELIDKVNKDQESIEDVMTKSTIDEIFHEDPKDPRCNDRGVFRIKGDFCDAREMVYDLLSSGYSVTVRLLNKENGYHFDDNWVLISYYF